MSNTDINKANLSLSQLDIKDEEKNDVCANCGKAGSSSNMNVCNKCKGAKYCNASCKKKHRHKHKTECEKVVQRIAELHNAELKRAAELHDIELFKQPPPTEDCPICMLRLPSMDSGRRYMACCGQEICGGCAHAPVCDHRGNRVNQVGERKCAFCRTTETAVDEEIIQRLKKRMKVGDPLAFLGLGCTYGQVSSRTFGLKRDLDKAIELWHKAAELGCATAHRNIGNEYLSGNNVRKDEKKAATHIELAAMMGDEKARGKLGYDEYRRGNMDRALKHLMIAVASGCDQSLSYIQGLFTNGDLTREDYAAALRSRQDYLDEIRSKQRDEAAAFGDHYKYY